MKDTSEGVRPISAKRQKILAKAFAQLRKSRAKVDPSILRKIRDIVSGSPALMKKLGLSGSEGSADLDMPLSQKQPPVMTEERVSTPVEKPKKPKADAKPEYEEIDQAKNMEIMAKLMALNPAAQDDIKAIIKKSGK